LDGRGMTITKGDSATLWEITESDEFRDLDARILMFVDGIQWEMWATGDEIDRIIGHYGKAVASL
jgi:hypothetical protein